MMIDTQNKKKKTVILSGFEREEIFQIVRLIRREFQDGTSIAFGSTTKHNLNWTLESLLEELHREHNEVKKIETAQKKALL